MRITPVLNIASARWEFPVYAAALANKISWRRRLGARLSVHQNALLCQQVLQIIGRQGPQVIDCRFLGANGVQHRVQTLPGRAHLLPDLSAPQDVWLDYRGVGDAANDG